MRLAALCAVCMLPVALLRRTAPEQALLLTAAIVAVSVVFERLFLKLVDAVAGKAAQWKFE